MSEKFCLKWNDFHSNVSKSFGLFRSEDYLHDVTLVSDDHKQVSAHKLVLSASSEYFKSIFKNNSNIQARHLVCLDGISSNYLNNIMDYIYNGEVQIFQENLDRFLSVAQRLKLEGLMGNEDTQPHEEPFAKPTSRKQEEDALDTIKEEEVSSVQRKETKRNPVTRDVTIMDKVVVPLSTEDVSEVENMVNQHIEKCSEGFKCKLCGKTAVLSRNLKNHIETHLEGLSFPCQQCGKTFRSRNALNTHIYKKRCNQ